MIIDFHTHGKLAKKLPFSTEYTDWLLNEAAGSGLDAICLTEHFNTLQFDELYGYLSDTCKRDGDTLIAAGGLRIFTGMETDIAEGGHILSIGRPEDIMELNILLEPYKERGYFLPFKKLMDIFEKYPVIVGAAHPYREESNIPRIPTDQLKRLHFLDLNGKDVSVNRKYYEGCTETLANILGVPAVCGSDTHQAVQYGCVYTKMCDTVNSVDKLYEQMVSGRYKTVISDDAAFRVKTAGLLKRALKEIHALKGDYVRVLTDSINV